MEKLHDNDEMEIDLIEILYALKKKGSYHSDRAACRSADRGSLHQAADHTSVQRDFDCACHLERDHTHFDRGPAVREPAHEGLQYADHEPERA